MAKLKFESWILSIANSWSIHTYSSYWPPLAGTPPSPSTYFLFFLNVVFIEIASVWKKMIDLPPCKWQFHDEEANSWIAWNLQADLIIAKPRTSTYIFEHPMPNPSITWNVGPFFYIVLVYLDLELMKNEIWTEQIISLVTDFAL